MSGKMEQNESVNRLKHALLTSHRPRFCCSWLKQKALFIFINLVAQNNNKEQHCLGFRNIPQPIITNFQNQNYKETSALPPKLMGEKNPIFPSCCPVWLFWRLATLHWWWYLGVVLSLGLELLSFPAATAGFRVAPGLHHHSWAWSSPKFSYSCSCRHCSSNCQAPLQLLNSKCVVCACALYLIWGVYNPLNDFFLILQIFLQS